MIFTNLSLYLRLPLTVPTSLVHWGRNIWPFTALKPKAGEISIHFPVQILCMLHRQKRCHLENCPNPSDQMDFLKRTRISSSPAAIWGERRCCAWMWNQSECSQNSRFFTQCWWWVAWGLWEHLYPTPSRRIKKHGATKTDALLLVYIIYIYISY